MNAQIMTLRKIHPQAEQKHSFTGTAADAIAWLFDSADEGTYTTDHGRYFHVHGPVGSERIVRSGSTPTGGSLRIDRGFHIL
jgi:hypothetical protein